MVTNVTEFPTAAIMKLTTEHTPSGYVVPVLIDEDGRRYGPEDKLPSGEMAFVWVVKNTSATDPLRDKFLRAYFADLMSGTVPVLEAGSDEDEEEDLLE